MFRKSIALSIALVALSAVLQAGSVHAENRFQNAGIDNDQLVYDALSKLQKAVAHNDRNTVASMMQYPMSVDICQNGSSKIDSVEIKNRRQFLKRYDWIINAQIKKLLRTAKPSDLSSSWRGVSFYSDPDIWFQETVDTNKIVISGITHVK